MIVRSLSLFVAGAALLIAAPAAADLVPDGKTPVAIELTIDGQAAFADTTFVVLGCNSDRHQVGFAKASEALRCKTKMPANVYAVPTKELKPLQDLVAKDLGWASEGIEARKLLEKTPSCGTIAENTMVEKSKNITFLTARYSLEKTASGCAIKKIGETVAQTSPAAATPASAATSAAAPASSAPPPAKSGCATTPGPDTSAPIGALGLGVVIAGLVLRRRRDCPSKR